MQKIDYRGSRIVYEAESELQVKKKVIDAFATVTERQKKQFPFKSSKYVCVRLPIPLTKYFVDRLCKVSLPDADTVLFRFEPLKSEPEQAEFDEPKGESDAI